jgi:glycosyltransferase involved in cell wall biosynthesis
MVKSAMNWTVIANPPDVRPLLWSARLAVGPFVVGGGSKIKLIEAMAAGAPVVATDAGVQGLSVVPGIHYVPSGPSPEEFARAIASVFHASDRLRQLRAAGLDLAAGMDWRRSFAAFPDLLQLARAAGSQSFSRQS